MTSQNVFEKNMVLFDYIGNFYMLQYFWPHTVVVYVFHLYSLLML